MEKKYWLVFVIFFLSGFAGLMTESLLAGILKGFVGSAFAGQVWVLILFMLGIGLGAWLSEKHFGKSLKLFKLYAFIELFSAFWLLSVSVGIDLLLSTYQSLPGEYQFVSLIFRAIVLLLVLLPPSIAMGMTFPVLFKAMEPHFVSKQKLISGLYGINVVGGVCGVLFTTFFISGTMDIRSGLAIAAVLFFVAGSSVFALKLTNVHASEIEHPEEIGTENRSVYFLAFFNGLLVFILEVSMLRMMVHITGSSFRSFDLMLAVFVSGLGSGALLSSVFIKFFNSARRMLSMVYLMLVFAAFGSIILYYFSFDIFSAWMQNLPRTAHTWVLYNIWQIGLSALVMFLPAFFAGLVLPVLLGESFNPSARRVGGIYAFNVLGCVVGALLTWLLLFPLVGSVGAVMTSAVLAFIIVIILKPGYSHRLAALILLMVIVAGVFTFFNHQSGKSRLLSGIFRTGQSDIIPQPVFFADGRTASVGITVDSSGLMSLIINGKADAAISMSASPGTDEPVEILLGALPLAIHTSPQKVAVIGLGSGLTSHVVLADPSVKELDVLEMEPRVAEASRNFGHRVARTYFDKRCQILFQDAATFFMHKHSAYDVIISEPSNPWVTGSSFLFTLEFMTEVQKALRPGGLFIQWIQLYENDLSGLSMCMKSLGDVFNFYTIYFADDRNVLVVAGNEIIPKINERLFRLPELAADLRRLGIYGETDLEIRKLGSRNWMHPFFVEKAAGIPVSSRYRSSLEKLSLMNRFFQHEVNQMDDIFYLLNPIFENNRPGLTAVVYPFAWRFHTSRQYASAAWLYQTQVLNDKAVKDRFSLDDALAWHKAALSVYRWANRSESDNLSLCLFREGKRIHVSDKVDELMVFYEDSIPLPDKELLARASVLCEPNRKLHPAVSSWIKLRCLHVFLLHNNLNAFDIFWHNFCKSEADKTAFQFIKSLRNQYHNQKLPL
ncbi:MAG: hypothetical protein Q7J34_08495 [Bacteroidales bacterium]|nr:hypothetical protein [Bacteroidales bacterium]